MWGSCQSNFKWKNLGRPLQKIKKSLPHKSLGQIDIVVSQFLFTILLVMLLFGFRTNQYMVTSAGVEDALAASNLASAIIDWEEYGKNHTIMIANTRRAFERFRDALIVNLNLDEQLNTTKHNGIYSQVAILKYIVYNVSGENIEIWEMDGYGNVMIQRNGKLGEVFTPDMVKVEGTTIYSKVGFWVEGLMEQQIYAQKEKSVDIKRCDSE